MIGKPQTFDPTQQYWGCNVDPYGGIHIFCGLVSAFLSATNLYYLEWRLVTDDGVTRTCDHTHYLFDTKEECCLFIYNQEMEKLDDKIEEIFQQRYQLSQELNKRLSDQ